ncbi:hypothetical protein WK39_26485 [Burkholderia cepacia]|uniref:hypothetical protein n=1 Tax=Burkholderia cepacia TaxID=292 RepID=UPI00075B058C|nr:hypothetical protein [Burkholderia cepacia]KVS52209.1 hypothetical protein WK39_26485 [Burkholderia cepacia]KVS54371.1 hypothetical protein WK40_31890 [Burkholderia cepacia]
MSTRTLIEINHDHLSRLIEEPERLAEIIRSACCDMTPLLNRANESGHSFDMWNGIQIVHQYHHSTVVKVITDYAEIKL